MTMPLAELLASLGLRHTAAHLDDLISTATKKRLAPLELLELFAERESQHRAKQSLERRLAHSRVGRFKPIADFEWNWPTRIDRDAIEAALRLEFLDGARNIVWAAMAGVAVGDEGNSEPPGHTAYCLGHFAQTQKVQIGQAERTRADAEAAEEKALEAGFLEHERCEDIVRAHAEDDPGLRKELAEKGRGLFHGVVRTRRMD